MARRARIRLIVLSLLVLTAALFARMREAPFVYEDFNWLATSETVPTSYHIPGRALSMASHAAVWSLAGGINAAAGHAANLAIHLGNGLLVLAIGGSLATPVVGAVAAGVFLLHPLSASAVMYVSARADLLMTMGALLAVWISLQRLTWWRMIAIALSLAVASLSKEIGVVAIVLVGVTLCLCRRSSMGYAYLAPLWIGIGVVAGQSWTAIASWAQMSGAAVNGVAQVPWTDFLLLQMTALWHLLALVPPSSLWFTGFSIDHDIVGLAPRETVLAGLLTVQTIAVWLWACWHAPLVAWGLAWVAVSVVPRFIFRTSEFLTEPQMYLSMTAISLMAGAAVVRVWAWRPRSSKRCLFDQLFDGLAPDLTVKGPS